MRILEQILEEIENFADITVEDDGYIETAYSPVRAGHYVSVEKAKEIIRSHMKNDGWIPVEKQGDPKKDGTYLCTFTGELCGIDEPFTGMCGYESGEWDEPDCVLAWQPRPEPYHQKEN